jgi:hypothetical protein
MNIKRWSPVKHISDKVKFSNDLASSLRAKGFEVTIPEYVDEPNALNNMSIIGNGKTYQMSLHNWYGFSRMGSTLVKIKDSKPDNPQYEHVEMTDKMYYTLLKGLIIHVLR